MNKVYIDEAIEKRRILLFSDGPKIASKELKIAKEDLKEAKDTLSKGRFKWATTQAYYAIFHATRALLYNKKYREKSHDQLALAIKALYIEEGLLTQEYYDNFIGGNGAP